MCACVFGCVRVHVDLFLVSIVPLLPRFLLSSYFFFCLLFPCTPQPQVAPWPRRKTLLRAKSLLFFLCTLTVGWKNVPPYPTRPFAPNSPIFFLLYVFIWFSGVLCTTTTTSASLSTCNRLSLPGTTNRSLPNAPSYFFSVPFTRSSLFGVRA